MRGLTPQAFTKKWSEAALSERSSYQQHFLDLCAMLGQPTPAEVDPTGEFFTFEKGVEKMGGGRGFADVWYRGHFAIEYKGKHKDLGAAYVQLQNYREALENPPLLVVTDMERFEIHTNFESTVSRVYSFTNAELPEAENLRVLRAMFEDPASLRPARTVESVTEEAAGKFARIADGLRGRGVEPHAAAHFLNKLLFCLFAEDIGLLPKGLFTQVVERGVRRPETFNANVGGLFAAMRDGGEFALQDIPRFNGGLYSEEDEESAVVPLAAEELKLLAEAARLDWESVEPAIFGTLFERSLDPSQRARLGAHYTSREDILAVVEPVLMAPLRREWDAVRERAEADAETARKGSGQKAVNVQRSAERALVEFAGRLRRVRVLDPACGSGNFLYVTLQKLLDLELAAINRLIDAGHPPRRPEVGPWQLRGIETSPYAHELAQVAVWIGYLQWMHDNGFGTRQEPILGNMTNIVEMDAILARDEQGNPVEPDWPEADVIVGNPPFLGGNRVRRELGDEYLNDLWKLYEDRVPAFADLVCYWFEKTRRQIQGGRTQRAGLLATNSIRGGVNRRVLERIKQTGDIFFAESDRPWVLNGAAVRVSMVGFDNGTELQPVLDGAPVANINANLSGDADITQSTVLVENKGISFQGPSPKGSFDIPSDVAHHMLVQRGNPNGRPNSDVVKPVVNASDIARANRGYWTIDFGASMSHEDAALYEAPFEYVKQHVYPERLNNNRKAYRERWWLYGEARVGMRKALEGLSRYIATPRHAKYRVFAWMNAEVLCNDAVIVFAREDDYFFGVLHSRAHELWALRMGTFLGVGNDPRYTPTTCFETFPLPWPPGEEPVGDPVVEEIAEAARRLDGLRRNWLDPEGATEAELKKRTLTNLYNQRPTWLANAHARLDRAVFAAYGWPEDISDEDILKNLLALNLERSGAR